MLSDFWPSHPGGSFHGTGRIYPWRGVECFRFELSINLHKIDIFPAGPKNSTRLQADISQLLLVCCWRAHKHVSEIFDWAVRTAYPSCIQADEIRTIGEYFWLQLTECRHCGAFESAVEGFTYLCSFLWRSKDPKMIKPIDWLRRILKSLEGGEGKLLCKIIAVSRPVRRIFRGSVPDLVYNNIIFVTL